MRRTRTLPARLALALALVAGAALAAPGPATAEGVRYLDPIFDVEVTEDLVYGEAMNNRGELQVLTLDLYEPEGDVATDRPVIVWAHGGGFTGGSKRDASMVALASAFSARGWVTASISYRVRPPGTPGSQNPAEMAIDSLDGTLPDQMRDPQHDMQAAVRWFRANAGTLGIDPDRIAAGGVSAGASMALETAFNPDDPGDSGNPGYSSEVAAAVSLSGGTDPRRIDPGAPPIVLFHGLIDPIAPYPVALLTCATTGFHDNVCEMHTYLDAAHDLSAYRDGIIAETADFLCRRVLDGCATGEGA